MWAAFDGVVGKDIDACLLRGVFVLLSTAPSEVHPAQVIPVLYPVSWGGTTGSAGQGGSRLVRSGFPGEESGQQLVQVVTGVCVVLG